MKVPKIANIWGISVCRVALSIRLTSSFGVVNKGREGGGSGGAGCTDIGSHLVGCGQGMEAPIGSSEVSIKRSEYSGHFKTMVS